MPEAVTAAAPARLGGAVLDALAGWAIQTPAAAALLGDDWEGLDYRGLAATVDALGATFRELGIARDDLILIVLPDGPSLPVAVLAAMGAGVAAPLSWGMTAHELAAAMSGGAARAVIVPAGEETPARAAATAAGLALFELAFSPGTGRGTFRLTGQPEPVGPPRHEVPASAEDIAVVVFSSGTTGRPKRIPRTHGNIAATSRDVLRVMALAASDRCLNVAPMAYSQGLNALFATVGAGSSLVALPSPDLRRLPDRVQTFAPTWMSATPTLLRAILADPAACAALREHPLRMIRASAGAFAGEEIAALEATLQTPVLHSYGMSEASFIAGEAYGSFRRKPGSPGLCNHTVAVIDAEGRFLPAGEPGEIVTRGPNVFPGYLDDAEANAAAFTPDGWFRTGDAGRLDADGYLFITGRLKELIKRGGQAIGPYEVEDALLADPAVAEACVFGTPHPLLGEEVAAVVVLRGGAFTTEKALRERVGARLAATKVPRTIVFTTEIPKGPTGKPKRHELAAAVAAMHPVAADDRGFREAPGSEAGADRIAHVARICADVLSLSQVDGDDDLFDLGMDSLRATMLLGHLQRTFGVDLPVRMLFEARTPARLARGIAAASGAGATTAAVTLQPGAAKRAVYYIPGGTGGGGHLLSGTRLAQAVDPARPFRGFLAEAGAADGAGDPMAWVAKTAAAYVAAMRTEQESGPYLLTGVCVGGAIAWEMACQLAETGETAHLFLIDARNPAVAGRTTAPRIAAAGRAGRNHRRVRRLTRARRAIAVNPGETGGDARRVDHVRRYVPRPFSGRVTLAANSAWLAADATLGWGDLLGDRLQIIPAGTSHRLRQRQDAVAAALRAWLQSVDLD